MTPADAGRTLEQAAAHLQTAEAHLLALDQGAGIDTWIVSAASLLGTLKATDLRGDANTFGPRLTEMAGRTATLSQLLESAVSLYLGRLGCTAETGYAADGTPQQLRGQGILQIDG